jgi:hypothetical protein
MFPGGFFDHSLLFDEAKEYYISKYNIGLKVYCCEWLLPKVATSIPFMR